MRLRHNRVRPLKQVHMRDNVTDELEQNQEVGQADIKDARPIAPQNDGFLRRIINNPNFAFQIMVIVLTLASDNLRMDRRIDTMTTKIDSIRGIAEVINNTMQSVKVAAEAPKHIRKLLQ